MPLKPAPVLLDLADFANAEQALARAGYGCPKGYSEIAKKHMTGQEDLSTAFMLFGSFVSRMRGLHEGVVREISASNPHAAFPLIRAWVETITIALYVLRNPTYVEYLLYGPGENRPGKKSFEAMFHAVREDASQLKLVYRELSDYSHFGSLGVWNAHSLDDEEEKKKETKKGRIVSWTDSPRWRDNRHFQVACAQAYELAVGGLDALDRLGGLLIPKSPISAGRG